MMNNVINVMHQISFLNFFKFIFLCDQICHGTIGSIGFMVINQYSFEINGLNCRMSLWTCSFYNNVN